MGVMLDDVIAGVMAAVYHAEVVAARVGEPFGAIAIAVIAYVIVTRRKA